jgi:hypothetical protein
MALQVASHSGLPERILARSASLPTSVDYAYEVTSSDPTEVLAVEIRQYVGGGEQMLVPRLIGQTGKARTKTSRAKRQWTEDEFFVALNELDPIAAEVARKIVHWARDRNLRTDWGSGMRTGGWFPVLDHGTEWYAPIALRTNGKIAFQFARLRRKPPFSAESVRSEFLTRLNAIPGIELPSDSINGLPTIALVDMQEEQRLTQLLSVLDWLYEVILKQAHKTSAGSWGRGPPKHLQVIACRKWTGTGDLK